MTCQKQQAVAATGCWYDLSSTSSSAAAAAAAMKRIDELLFFSISYVTLPLTGRSLLLVPAASIWFVVWGVVNPVAEIFDSSRKNVRFSRKMSDFPGKNSDELFLVNSKNCVFSLNIHNFTFSTCILC